MNSIRIFLPKQGDKTVCPLHVLVIGMHKVLHFPVYKEQGKEQYPQQQGISDDNLYF